jgi:ATP-dependent exoDNAse (exonuclease V) alpha subunit
LAIFSLKTTPVQRAKGQSAVACAAYRSATKLYDQRIDQTFDYTRRRGVEHAEIVLPIAAAKEDNHWARDRQALWNTAERCEKRKDARPAREYLIAVPHELTKAQRLVLSRTFAADIANRYNVAADFAIHQPHRSGDKRNYHVHILTTTRELSTTGLGAKTSMEWSNTNRYRKGLGATAQEIEFVRGRWESIANNYFRELGLSIRIDRRSLAAQGIDREPTKHLGPAVTGMERRGMKTRVVERIAVQKEQAAKRRLEHSAELARITEAEKWVDQAQRVLGGRLEEARTWRAQGHEPHEIEERQRQSAENWLMLRGEQVWEDPDRTRRRERALAHGQGMGAGKKKSKELGHEHGGMEIDFDL